MQNENIVVAVRVRPYTRQELERHENTSAFEISPHTNSITQRLTHAKHNSNKLPAAHQLLPYASQPNATSSTGVSTVAVPLSSALTFQCDRLYPSTSSTAELYDGCVRDIVDSAMSGMNGTVFCYGQTASGKTWTMKGDSAQPGLLALSLHHVFSAIERRMGDKWLLRVSYIEIYNERIRDLLEPSNDNLAVHVSKEKGAHVTPREEVVRSVEECAALLEEGEKHRHYGCTQMNDFSSRSHTIFRLTIENKPQPPQQTQHGADASAALSSATATSYQPPAPRKKDRVRVSVLNFVDLAGSERQAQTGAQGSRLKEGSFINKSLLNLGLVIAKLSEQHKAAGGSGSSGDGSIPFRDSKLTHILSGSLGGNSRVCVVCCVSAALVNCEHSVSTLRFGARCARVRQSVKVNEVSGDAAEINRYEGKIKQLQNRLSVLPAQHGHSATAAATAAVAAEAAKARVEAERSREEKEAMWEQRRLLAEDKVRIEEERGRLEQQIASFKQLMLTASSQQLTGAAAKQAALSKRRATLGNGRRSGEWKEATSPSPLPLDSRADDSDGALTAEQRDFFRSQQQTQRAATLESRVHSLETLLKELNGENDGLMAECEQTAADGEAMTARLEQLLSEAKQRNAQLDEERRLRAKWEKGEGVEALTDSELEEMRRGVEEVRRVVERQVMWREFCRARENGGGPEEASSMERERRLKEELQQLRQQRALEQQSHEAAHSAMSSEQQSLQQQQAEMAARLTDLQQRLEAEQDTASRAAAESAEWRRQYEATAAEEKKLRDENTEYSKRLLDVVRPASGVTLPPVPLARLAHASAREASSMDSHPLPLAVTYSAAASAPSSPVMAAVSPVPAATPHFAPVHSYSGLPLSLFSTASSTSSLSFQPSNLSSAVAAAAASSPAPSTHMSAHMPYSASPASLPPPLSLDALMSGAAPPPLPAAPFHSSHSSPLPLADLPSFSLNTATPGWARPPTGRHSRPPSPYTESASKEAHKPQPLSANKRPAAAVSARRR